MASKIISKHISFVDFKYNIVVIIVVVIVVDEIDQRSRQSSHKKENLTGKL